MFVSMIIVFREAMEAGLIVGIVLPAASSADEEGAGEAAPAAESAE